MTLEDGKLGQPQDYNILYDQAPVFDSSLYDHPVYQRAPALFDRMLDREGFADASDLLNIMDALQLQVKDASFFDETQLDTNGRVELKNVSAYMLSRSHNATLVLQVGGNIYVIPIERFQVLNGTDPQTGDGIRMRIPASNELISMDFSLEAHDWVEPEPAYGFPAPSDVDKLFLETKIPPLENKMKAIAYQRHADYYLNLLMILDTMHDRDRLYLEIGQMRLAVERVLAEEAGSVFPSEFLRHKFEGVSGDYVEMMLSDLLQRTTPLEEEEGPRYEEAIVQVERNFAHYGIKPDVLRSRIKDLTPKKR